MNEKQQPVVGVVMGSDSDWPVMEAAATALEEFGIAYETDVVSAHRMPTEMIEYGQRAHERGLRVIIAGAGGAARKYTSNPAADVQPVFSRDGRTLFVRAQRRAGFEADRWYIDLYDRARLMDEAFPCKGPAL